MPVITITTVEGRTLQEKQSMITVVTEAVERIMQKDRAVIRVIINEMRPENYALAGITFNDRRLNANPEDAKNDIVLEIKLRASKQLEDVDSLSDKLMDAVKDHPAFTSGDIRIIFSAIKHEAFKIKFYKQ